MCRWIFITMLFWGHAVLSASELHPKLTAFVWQGRNAEGISVASSGTPAGLRQAMWERIGVPVKTQQDFSLHAVAAGSGFEHILAQLTIKDNQTIMLFAALRGNECIPLRQSPSVALELLQHMAVIVQKNNGDSLHYLSFFSAYDQQLASAVRLEQHLQGLQDTARILKAGLRSYETLLSEQDAFIDTLLMDMKENARRNNAPQPLTAGLADSLKLLKRELVVLKKQLEAPGGAKRGAMPSAALQDSLRMRGLELNALSQTLMDSRSQAAQREAALVKQIESLENRAQEEQAHLQKQAAEITQLQRLLAEAQQTERSMQDELTAVKQRIAETQFSQEKQRRALISFDESSRTRIQHLNSQLSAMKVELAMTQQAQQMAQRDLSLTEKALLEAELNAAVRETQYRDLRKQYAALSESLRQNNLKLLEAQLRNDSLWRAGGQNAVRLRRMQQREDSLRREIAMLDPESAAAKAQRRAYVEQLTKLEAQARQLGSREDAILGREKKLLQREKYLNELSGTNLGELLERLQRMEAELQSLKNP